MNPIINSKPKFFPYDICRIKGTNEIVLVTEVNCNIGQVEDQHQWSFAVEPITEGNSKCAWFEMNELEYLANIFEIIVRHSQHPFSSSAFKFSILGRRE